MGNMQRLNFIAMITNLSIFSPSIIKDETYSYFV